MLAEKEAGHPAALVMCGKACAACKAEGGAICETATAAVAAATSVSIAYGIGPVDFFVIVPAACLLSEQETGASVHNSAIKRKTRQPLPYLVVDSSEHIPQIHHLVMAVTICAPRASTGGTWFVPTPHTGRVLVA